MGLKQSMAWPHFWIRALWRLEKGKKERAGWKQQSRKCLRSYRSPAWVLPGPLWAENPRPHSSTIGSQSLVSLYSEVWGADLHLVLSGYGWFLVPCLFCFVLEGSMLPWILLTPFGGFQSQNVTWNSVSQVSTTAIWPPQRSREWRQERSEISPVVLLLGVLLVVVTEFVLALRAPLKCHRFSSSAKGTLLCLYPVGVSPLCFR